MLKQVLKIQAAAAALAAFACGAQAQQAVDVVIRGGTVYDGSEGSKGFVGDVAVSGDKIVYVGPHANVTAKRTIDAKGKIVSPGFIDGHSHSSISSTIPTRRSAAPPPI